MGEGVALQSPGFVIISAPHFVAAVDLTYRRAAPIVAYMKNWDFEQIVEYCKQKQWEYFYW